jgi:ATP-dependent protease HslVU (ClpYQ) peptidase subunit
MGRVTLCGETVVTDGKRKVHKLPDGRLYGWAGSHEDGERLRLILRKNLPLIEMDNLHAIMINLNGTIGVYEGSMWTRHEEPHYAIGTGGTIALAAMDAGATAKEAVKIGIKRDPSSGGKITTVRLK